MGKVDQSIYMPEERICVLSLPTHVQILGTGCVSMSAALQHKGDFVTCRNWFEVPDREYFVDTISTVLLWNFINLPKYSAVQLILSTYEPKSRE